MFFILYNKCKITIDFEEMGIYNIVKFFIIKGDIMVYDFFEELKSIIREWIKGFYSKFKYGLLLISLVLSVLCILLFNKQNPVDVESQQMFLFGITIENWLQWITIVTIPYTAIWAIFQYKKNLASKKQEKSAQIAKEFAKTLVNDLDVLEKVYTKSSLVNFFPFQEEKIDKFKYFNVTEIRNIYDDKYVSAFRNAKSKYKVQLDNLYHLELYKNNMSYSQNKHIDELYIKILKNQLEKSDIEELESVFQKSINLPYHFFDLESKILNQLEYICMDISSKVADSNYIYQSLHQMFLRSMRFLGIQISIANINSTDKTYTNIIYVYNEWRAKYKRNLRLEKRRIKKSNEALNPKIKTV